jgi:hypothetical protein
MTRKILAIDDATGRTQMLSAELAQAALAAQTDTTYYVSSIDGSNLDDGLTPATAFLTLAYAESIIPLDVQAIYEIVMLDVGPFVLDYVRPREYGLDGCLYFRSDVDNELLSSTCGAGCTDTVLNGLVGLVADDLRCWWVEILDGAAAGQIRQVISNTTVSIQLGNFLYAVPAPGDAFRVFRPSTTITDNGSNIALAGPRNVNIPEKTGALCFERVVFDTNEVRIGGKVRMWIAELIKLNQVIAQDYPSWGCLISGNDPKIADAVHGIALSGQNYAGAGVTMLTGAGGVIGTTVNGHFCARGVAPVFYAGRSWIANGRFDTGLILDGTYDFVHLYADGYGGAGGIRFVAAKLTLRNGAQAVMTNATLSAAAGNALLVQSGSRLSISATVSVLGLAATAALVETDAELQTTGNATITGTGGASYGVQARYGGKVRLAGSPSNITGGLIAFAAGEAPITATAASFSSIGVLMADADGSVVQRVA